MNLRAALQDVQAFLGSNNRVAIEVGGALLELREVLDRPERTLRAEEALDVHPAQRRRLDAAAVLLRADVADEVERSRRVAVDVAVEAGHAPHPFRLLGLAVGGRVELLLRELRDEEAQSVELLRVED